MASQGLGTGEIEAVGDGASAAPEPRGGRAWALLQAAVVAAAFSMLLAGTNAMNPLLPVYRDLLGLDPFVLSLTFVNYVTLLVAVLLLLARPRATRLAAPLLLAALATSIGSDALLWLEQEWSILAGRAVAGVAGGIGTGAAAALVVAAVGAPGRALSATGNLVGAVVGTAGSQMVVGALVADGPRAVAVGHAGIVLVLLALAAVVLGVRRRENRAALADLGGATAALRLDARAARSLGIGAIGWIGLSTATVFGATVFADLGRPLVQAVGPALLLGSSAAAQLASPWLARLAPRASGVLVVVAGVAGIVVGALAALDAVALVGSALVGAGIGVSYRVGLVALTRGTTPARQGALSSLYAAVTYAAAAIGALLVGWVAVGTGLVVAALGALTAVGVAALLAVLWAPRLGDTLEPGRP